MRLEVQYSKEDFREAQGEAWGQKSFKTKRAGYMGLLGWLVLLFVIGALWVVMTKMPNQAVPSATPQPITRQPVQDLMVTLLPNTVLAVVFLTFLIAVMVANVSMSRRRVVFGNQARREVGHMGQIFVIISVLFIIAAVVAPMVSPVVHWRPSRMQALLAAFAPWLLSIFVLVFVFKWYTKTMIGVAWDQNPALHRPHVLEFSEEGMTNSDVHAKNFFRWAAFVRYRETENLCILVLEDTRFVMVPKRAFADQMMQLEFRALIQSQIKEGYFLTQPQGAFEVLPPPPLVKT